MKVKVVCVKVTSKNNDEEDAGTQVFCSTRRRHGVHRAMSWHKQSIAFVSRIARHHADPAWHSESANLPSKYMSTVQQGKAGKVRYQLDNGHRVLGKMTSREDSGITCSKMGD